MIMNEYVNLLVKEALRQKDVLDDIDTAMKFATLASISSFSPRADVCCIIGELYYIKGNYLWAVKWYENALGNIPEDINEIDNDYYTTIPLQKLTIIENLLGNLEKAYMYNESYLKLNPKDELALENKKKLCEYLAF